MRALVLTALLAACTDPGAVRTGKPGGGEGGGEGSDDTATDPDVETVAVSHDRELRGAWIATVWNINFPETSGAASQQAELAALVDAASACGLNALFFQARPEGDALYDSDLEPWSRYLTGTQGTDPGYDPLATLVELAHAAGIEVHAWFNPYRGAASTSSTLVSPHLCADEPDVCHVYSSYRWMDPGAEVVRERTAAVVLDVATRTGVDGVHFDDYFYPYPDGTEFPDDDTWAIYESGGGTMSRDDWRRDNVHKLVEQIHDALAAEAPEVRFGIAPFGIYKSGSPSEIVGLDQVDSLYSDPLVWLEGGWLDYLAPQLYWPSTQTAQAYEPLLDWWTAQAAGGTTIFAGNNLADIGSSSAWTVSEYETQLAISRAYAEDGSLGNIWYHIEPLADDSAGICAALAAAYATPALPPVVRAVADQTFAAPTVTAEDGGVAVSHRGEPRVWLVYAADGDGWALDRIVPATEASISLDPGTWAISAAGRGDVESRGAVVTVP